jgi:hypothetical protein
MISKIHPAGGLEEHVALERSACPAITSQAAWRWGARFAQSIRRDPWQSAPQGFAKRCAVQLHRPSGPWSHSLHHP